MPLPRPHKHEAREDFVSRFMSDNRMESEFPDRKQRVAVAFRQWRSRGRKVNPDDQMSQQEMRRRLNARNAPSREAVKSAEQLYKDFTGMDVDSVEEVDVPDIEAAVCVGTMDGIMYTTTRDDVTEHYIHEFEENARPLLCVSHDGRVMVILGGEFQFGSAGFEDDPVT